MSISRRNLLCLGDAFWISMAEFRDLQLYLQPVLESFVATLRVVQGEVPEQPL